MIQLPNTAGFNARDFRQIPRYFLFLRKFIAPQFSGSAV